MSENIIPGAASVAAELIGRDFPERWGLGWSCHNPCIRIDSSGIHIGPDGSLAPHGGGEADLDCVGDLDPDAEMQSLARRVERLDDWLQTRPSWDRRVQGIVERYVREFAAMSAPFISHCFKKQYLVEIAAARELAKWEDREVAYVRLTVGSSSGANRRVLWFVGSGQEALDMKRDVEEQSGESSTRWAGVSIRKSGPKSAQPIEDFRSIYELGD